MGANAHLKRRHGLLKPSSTASLQTTNTGHISWADMTSYVGSESARMPFTISKCQIKSAPTSFNLQSTIKTFFLFINFFRNRLISSFIHR